MNKRFRTILQYTFFLGLGIFLVWWSIKDLSSDDKSQIRAALQTARYYLLIPILSILFLSHLVRALRWRLLINSLGYNATVTNTFFAVMIGYLTNMAFPRLGEVLRCTVLARYEKVPADKLIGTVILERLIDALTLLVIFGITFVIQPHFYAELIDAFFHSSKTTETKSTPLYIIALIGIGFIGLCFGLWMLIKKKNFNDLLNLFRKIGRSLWQGVSAVQHLKKRKQFIMWTVVLWTLYLSGGYLGFMALKETQQYGLKEAFAVLSAGSVGVIVTPGGIGAYALIIEKTMQIYGLQKGVALAFGWIIWLAQTGVILVGGLLSFIFLPWFNKTKKSEES
jgi:glycosyltransferase 2 family protein